VGMGKRELYGWWVIVMVLNIAFSCVYDYYKYTTQSIVGLKMKIVNEHLFF
jgi:hypothetical protein